MTKESWIKKGIEFSKKLELTGTLVGLGMIVFGIVEAGTGLAVGGAVGYFLTNEIGKRVK